VVRWSQSGAQTVVGPLALGTICYWRVRAKSDAGYCSYSPTRRFITILTTSVELTKIGEPKDSTLPQNYPNPFNSSTVIQFALPKRSYVTVAVFDQLGRQVATLVSQNMDAGYFLLRWNANVPSGIYFYRLQAGEFMETKKMILLR
jgi:hypothetical protein